MAELLGALVEWILEVFVQIISGIIELISSMIEMLTLPKKVRNLLLYLMLAGLMLVLIYAIVDI